MTRSCDECSACCTPLAIPEIMKPPGVRCKHLSVVGGCSIYSQRPKACRDYECIWLMGIGDPEHRPDKLGLLFSPWENRTDTGLDLLEWSLIVYEVRRGAAKTQKGVAFLDRVALFGFLVFLGSQVRGPDVLLPQVQEWCLRNGYTDLHGILKGADGPGGVRKLFR